MKKVVIFGGTTEGRLIAGNLAKSGISCDVRVATDYGEQVLDQAENISVSVARLNCDEMKDLFSDGYAAVIDATHPFAAIASGYIKEACGAVQIPLFRFERKTAADAALSAGGEGGPAVTYVPSTAACIEALKATTGPVFLSTGSKDLHLFAEDEQLRQRLVVRVLPAIESLKLCYDAGLTGKQIIAMQGPFSVTMNKAQLQEYGISILVTKESGKAGGLEEKLQAASQCGVQTFVIQPPAEAGMPSHNADSTPVSSPARYEICTSYSQLYQRITELTGVPVSNECHLSITLTGIGPGSEDGMTVAVRKAVTDAEYLFGAERMIQSVTSTAKKLPYYQAKDIIPELNRIQSESTGVVNVVVLFSGDTGFYSGQEKLRQALESLPNSTMTVLPGISSLQLLCAKTGVSWQNMRCISMHGVPQTEWLPEFFGEAANSRNMFLLTSGPHDVQGIGKMLQAHWDSSCVTIYVGYNLSYPDEKVMKLTPAECESVQEPGLYVMLIVFLPHKKEK